MATSYSINKQGPTPSVRSHRSYISRSSHFKGKVKLKKISREEYYSMSMAQRQQLYELLHKAGLSKGEKIPDTSKVLKVKVAMIQAKTDNNCNECLFG